MGLEIPQQRRNVRQIQINRQNVPLDQIIAVKGQSPVGQGIQEFGQVLGQALQRRAELRRQAEQVAGIQNATGINLSGITDPSIALSVANHKESVDARKQQAEDMKSFKLLMLNNQMAKVPDVAQSKENANQDRLEKIHADRLSKIVSSRSGGLGLQDSKVNQAIDLRNLVNQTYNPQTKTYDIPPSMHSELVLGLARLLSPNGTIGIELEQELKQKTAREGLANAMTYLTGTPFSGPPQDVAKLFVHSIDRQGLTSEKLRDKYLSDLKSFRPSGLDRKRAENLEKGSLGSSFKQLYDQSPDVMSNQLQPFPSQVPVASGNETPAQRKARLIQELQGAQ